MRWIDSIHKQPKRTRLAMFWLSVIATFSLVGSVWFRSVERNVYALLNPGQSVQEQFFAGSQEVPSLFGDIRQAFGDLRASLTDVFSGGSTPGPEEVISTPTPTPNRSYLLPVEQ